MSAPTIEALRHTYNEAVDRRHRELLQAEVARRTAADPNFDAVGSLSYRKFWETSLVEACDAGLEAVAELVREATTITYADIAADIYAAGGRDFAIAEARAAYWKASFLVEMAKRGDSSAGLAEDRRLERDRALEKLKALGAEP